MSRHRHVRGKVLVLSLFVLCSVNFIAPSVAEPRPTNEISTGLTTAPAEKHRKPQSKESSLLDLLGCGAAESTSGLTCLADSTSSSLGRDSTTSSTVTLAEVQDFMRQLLSRRSRQVVIGLEGVVARTVAKNLNIKIQDLGVASAQAEIEAQKGIYDLRLGASLSIDRTNYPPPYNGSPPAGMPESQKEKNRATQASVGQLLPTGGLVELLFQQSGVDTNTPTFYSPYYTSGAGIQFSQPLLKNGGRFVTNAGIRLAEVGSKLADETYRQQLFSELSKSISLYYELIFATANVDVLKISLAQALELQRVNTAKFNAGVLPELDVLQAKAEVAARQQLLLTAMQNVEDISDQLKNQLAEIAEMRDVTLVPLDLPAVPDYDVKGKEVAFIKEALEKRPEFAQVRLALEQADVRRRVAKNQTLPQLDLFARYLAIGVDHSASDAWHESGSNDYGNWRVGIQFSYPLQNRSARYRLQQADNALRQAELLMEKAQHDIIQDVRTSLRAVETNRQQIKVGMTTVEFNREKVDTGMKRQAVGLATSFEVLRFQTDLAAARVSLLRAVVDYNKSIVQLERAKGSLLETLGLPDAKVKKDSLASQTAASKSKPSRAASR